MSEEINKEELARSMFGEIDSIISETKLDNVSAEGSGFDELPCGYFLCECVKAEMRRNKDDKPMVWLNFHTVGTGYQLDDTTDEWNTITDSSGKPLRAGQSLSLFYVLKDANSFKRFVADMLKFEDPEVPNQPLLPKEKWVSAEYMYSALQYVEVLKSRIWINRYESENKDGVKSIWSKPISWQRAIDNLRLPEE